MIRKTVKLTMIAALLLLVQFTGMLSAKSVVTPIRISTQQRIPSDLDQGAFVIANTIESWIPTQTAIIICDMWDKHWCPDATSRVAEIAPVMNEVLTIARDKGVKIVHAPSDC
ncbi:MAG: hypothetical protein EZS26_003895, partial [Candidatus Ordinivivax streblomastigis]